MSGNFLNLLLDVSLYNFTDIYIKRDKNTYLNGKLRDIMF